MHTTTTTLITQDREVRLTANPVDVAGGIRLMARHLAETIDTATAHPTRLIEVADQAEALLADACALIGEHQQDRKVRRRIAALRDAAEAR